MTLGFPGFIHRLPVDPRIVHRPLGPVEQQAEVPSQYRVMETALHGGELTLGLLGGIVLIDQTLVLVLQDIQLDLHPADLHMRGFVITQGNVVERLENIEVDVFIILAAVVQRVIVEKGRGDSLGYAGGEQLFNRVFGLGEHPAARLVLPGPVEQHSQIEIVENPVFLLVLSLFGFFDNTDRFIVTPLPHQRHGFDIVLLPSLCTRAGNQGENRESERDREPGNPAA